MSIDSNGWPKVFGPKKENGLRDIAALFPAMAKNNTKAANSARIVACVNACRGMADPEKEIAELRAGRAESAAEIERLRGALTTIAEGCWDATYCTLTARAALAPDAGREGITTAQKLDAAKEVLCDIVSDCEHILNPGLYKLAKDALEQLK